MSSAKWRPFCLGLNVLNGVFIACMSHYVSFFYVDVITNTRSDPDAVSKRPLEGIRYHASPLTISSALKNGAQMDNV